MQTLWFGPDCSAEQAMILPPPMRACQLARQKVTLREKQAIPQASSNVTYCNELSRKEESLQLSARLFNHLLNNAHFSTLSASFL